MSKFAKPALAVSIAAAVVLTGGNIAYADAVDPATVVANEVSSLVSDAAPDAGAVLGGVASGGGVVVGTDTALVEVPADAAQGVQISANDGSFDFTVPLPTEVETATAATAQDGTVVYQGDGSSDVAVQVLDTNSVRVQTIINDSSAPDAYSYELGEGATLAVGEDGVYYAIQVDGSFAEIQKPWAKDAAGNDVPTWYELDGDTLVQRVELSEEVAYPVVADPTWTWYNAAYGVKWNKKETKQIADSGTVAGACGFIAPRAPAIGAVCGIYGIYLVSQAITARNDGWCVFTAVAPAPLVLRYKDSVCK